MDGSHLLAERERNRGEVKVMGVLHIVLPAVGMAMLRNSMHETRTQTHTHTYVISRRTPSHGARGQVPRAC